MAVALLITSILIVLIMLLGNQSGNFVVKVESGDASKSIAITDDYEDRVYTNKLVANGIEGMTNTTPRWFLDGDTSEEQNIGLKELTKDLGNVIDDSTAYIYTFLIVNTGSNAVSIRLEMTVSNVSNGVDEAVRVMSYNDDSEDINIYQKPDVIDTEYKFYPATPQLFASENIVYDESVTVLPTTDPENPTFVKYSVIFWLEGQDPECTESIFNGTIKFSLKCSVAQ
jgi:hypothetical protein